jgi:hypothetical protein
MSCFELDGGQHAKRGVSALPVVEDLQVAEDLGGSSTRVFQRLRSRSSTCIRAQNDSIIALS